MGAGIAAGCSRACSHMKRPRSRSTAQTYIELSRASAKGSKVAPVCVATCTGAFQSPRAGSAMVEPTLAAAIETQPYRLSAESCRARTGGKARPMLEEVLLTDDTAPSGENGAARRRTATQVTRSHFRENRKGSRKSV